MPDRLHGPRPAWLPSLICLLIIFAMMPPSVTAADVHVVVYEGPITPVAAEFLVQSIERAALVGAEAVIIALDTPGGLDTSMREIIKAELNASVPVVVFISPAGSRAASAGAFITVAAHVAAMAPGTNIGSASPVQMMGAGMDSTMAHKVTNDAAAYISSIAEQKGRNAEIARAFVTEAMNITATEALELGVIEIMAPSVAALLDSLQGREVILADSRQTLETASANLVHHQMSVRQKFLKILVDPNVAYLLMLLGIYGIFFELSNPGSLVPGILGSIALLLALFAFQALPVDYSGFGLILLGVILLILEVKVPSYGALSIGGTAALVLGSLMLFDAPEQWARVSMTVMIPSVIVFVGFFVLCVLLVIRGQKRPVVTGKQAMVGETGRVTSPITGGDQPGKIVVHGEVWNAIAEEPLGAETRARVVQVKGRIVQVESIPDEDSSESLTTQPRS